VLNGGYPVSDELQARVQKAMGDLNFHPSAVARGLRRQRTLSIGVLISKLNDSFFSTFGYTVEKALFANGYRALLCSTEEALEKETAYIDSLIEQRVDGVIMFPREHSRENVQRLMAENIPVVVVERRLDLPTHHVLVENYAGGCSGIKHLLDMGHCDIAIFASHADRYPMRDRMRGAMDALRDAGITMPPHRMLTLKTDTPCFDLGYDYAMTVLEQRARPTAIFALTDEIAMGAMHAIIRQGVKVPEEMSIIGFDDISMASIIIPELTTVAQPITQMAETAAAILLRALEDGSEDAEQVTLQTRLVVRNSTAPPA
jgi:LacI family transcriptional regulator